MINADSFLMCIVFSGLALCGAYFRSQYIDWRQKNAAQAEERYRDCSVGPTLGTKKLLNLRRRHS